jgi:hypothetical protein
MTSTLFAVEERNVRCSRHLVERDNEGTVLLVLSNGIDWDVDEALFLSLDMCLRPLVTEDDGDSSGQTTEIGVQVSESYTFLEEYDWDLDEAIFLSSCS